jgi:cytochrome c553
MTNLRAALHAESVSVRNVALHRRRWLTICAASALLALVTGCTSTDRSRTLGDARVSGTIVAAQVCSTCHGATGNSTSPMFPKLAGQQEEYLTLQLKSFRSHRRSDPKGHEYMWGLASPLTDEQVTSLATYYATQHTDTAKAFPEHSADAGRIIYEQGDAANSVPACISCHGSHAEGNKLFPRLAGQHADYTVSQLRVFQGTDQRPDGTMMKGVAHSLTEKNMKDVAHYLENFAH